MLTPKWFHGKLYFINHFDSDDFCDYCDEYGECNIDPKICPILQNEKKKHKLVNYVEFELEKLDFKKPEYVILDSARIMSIQIGKRKCKFKKFFEKKGEIKYIVIKCKDLKYKSKEFQWGKNYYVRRVVYFALKCIKKPEILVPWCNIAPLIIRNNKITINIAPKVYEILKKKKK